MFNLKPCIRLSSGNRSCELLFKNKKVQHFPLNSSGVEVESKVGVHLKTNIEIIYVQNTKIATVTGVRTHENGFVWWTEVDHAGVGCHITTEHV